MTDPSEPRCGNCKWWGRNYTHPGNPFQNCDRINSDQSGLSFRAVKPDWDVFNDFDQLALVGGNAQLRPKADFHCAYFEPKEPEA